MATSMTGLGVKFSRICRQFAQPVINIQQVRSLSSLLSINQHKLISSSSTTLSSNVRKFVRFQNQPLLEAFNVNKLNSSKSLTTLTTTTQNSTGIIRKFLESGTPQLTSVRTKIRFSWKKGKPKTVRSVVDRFFRLDWGGWIRPRAGRRKKQWRKGKRLRYRLRQHVFCTAGQSKKLDHMVTDFWKKPKHYVDDPFKVYHKRTNMPKAHKDRPQFLP